MTRVPEAHKQVAQEPIHVYSEPHRWALSPWARSYRRLARRWTIANPVRKFCRPFTVEGAENLAGLQNPLLVISNHTSHFDTAVVLHILPGHVYARTAIAAAADRMYRDRWKGIYNSLRYNSFPITRGGGLKALAYSQWLLDNGWSLLIFPEGRRSRTGELLPFHVGPAMLATTQNVPALPIYISGANDILPPGEKWARPAPVTARVGPLLRFPPGMSLDECRREMEDAVRRLALTPAYATV